MEYTQRIDGLIAELLRSRPRVGPEHLPGIPDEDGARFLELYAELHGQDGSVAWDGTSLRNVRSVGSGPAASDAEQATVEPSVAATPKSAGVRDAGLSPVDQILAEPVGASMLDTKPSGGAVSAWMWLLPLAFLVPGGILAWWLTRETNRTIARWMLATGVIMTVVTVASGSALRGLMNGMLQAVGK